jgi:hypothetical protein
MIVIMAFGSSLTLFYWGKLLIKVLSTRNVAAYERSIENRVSGFEWFAEGAHAVGVFLVAACVGLLSEHVVGPYAMSAFPGPAHTFLHIEPVVIVVLLGAVLFLPALALWASTRLRYDMADFYTSGRTANAEHVMGAALGGTRAVTLRNYYLDGVIDGALVFRVGTLVCGALLGAMVLIGMAAR